MSNDDIQGTILDEAGNPISGAVVALIPDEGDSGDNVLYTTTDANGNYLFDAHPQGDGTTQQWHIVAQYQDGGGEYNTLSRPNVSAALPGGGTVPDSENLHAEYDAIKESASAGDTLTSIRDHSGGFGPLSGSATYQDAALNNAPAFVLNSSNNDILDSTSLNSNLSAPQTVYLVYRLDNTNSSANCVGFGRGSGPDAELAYRTRAGGNDRDSVQDTTSDGFRTSYSTDIQTPHISAFVLNSTAVIERDDKSAESFSNFSTGSYGAFAIGPDTIGDLWDGPISACLVYSAAHSQSTRDQVFDYLSPRFGF